MSSGCCFPERCSRVLAHVSIVLGSMGVLLGLVGGAVVAFYISAHRGAAASSWTKRRWEEEVDEGPLWWIMGFVVMGLVESLAMIVFG